MEMIGKSYIPFASHFALKKFQTFIVIFIKILHLIIKKEKRDKKIPQRALKDNLLKQIERALFLILKLLL